LDLRIVEEFIDGIKARCGQAEPERELAVA
jgi:hypothetical protein